MEKVLVELHYTYGGRQDVSFGNTYEVFIIIKTGIFDTFGRVIFSRGTNGGRLIGKCTRRDRGGEEEEEKEAHLHHK